MALPAATAILTPCYFTIVGPLDHWDTLLFFTVPFSLTGKSC
jgi:hypothetical protein